MLLKRQEKDEKIKSIYASSNICASIYDKNTKDFTIIFNNGGQYVYSTVSETDYTRFELADSQGLVFNSHIKKYPFVKLDKIDTKAILTEVTEIKTNEETIKFNYTLKLLMDKMKNILDTYEISKTVEPLKITNLKDLILDYEKVKPIKTDIIND